MFKSYRPCHEEGLAHICPVFSLAFWPCEVEGSLLERCVPFRVSRWCLTIKPASILTLGTQHLDLGDSTQLEECSPTMQEARVPSLAPHKRCGGMYL